jgi:hypothetical protein
MTDIRLDSGLVPGRSPSAPADDPELNRSMRVLELAMALLSFAAVLLLALLR